MRNLLSCGFLRLGKSALFRMVLLSGLGLTVFACVQQYYEKKKFAGSGGWITLEAVLFQCAVTVGLALALFIPLFFGVENGDGTVRNKLAVGHTRAAVYGAAFVVSFAAGAAFCAVSLAAALLFGIPLLGGPTAPGARLAASCFGILLMTAAFCALFLLVTMNCSRPSVAAALCMLLLVVLFILAIAAQGRLEEPEFVTDYTLTVDGGIDLAEPVPNPLYPRGAVRSGLEFLLDALPTGQAIQYVRPLAGSPVRMMLLAVCVTALAAFAGLARFAKKDLR